MSLSLPSNLQIQLHENYFSTRDRYRKYSGVLLELDFQKFIKT